MDHLITLPQALERAADRTGYGFTFIRDDLSEDTLTWAALHVRAKEIAVALKERGMKKGDHVAIVLPEAGEFIPTFLGIAQGGGVPVPLYPPMGVGQLGGYLDHCKHIVSASRAGLVITNRQIKAVLGTLHDHAPSLREMLTYADLDGDATLFRDPGLTPDDPCFIQFTSGSTSMPKGVVVTHGNLAHNAYAIMREGLQSDEQDRGVSWLPLFHDMGLIGFVIAPIHHRVPVSFMSPMTFLKRPVTWLEIPLQAPRHHHLRAELRLRHHPEARPRARPRRHRSLLRARGRLRRRAHPGRHPARLLRPLRQAGLP